MHHVICKLHNRRLLASSTRVDDTNNNEGVEGTCPSAQPDPRTYLCERTLSPPSALLDTKNAHAQPFYIRGTLLILAHTQSHLLKTCTSLEIKANHIQKDSCARVHLISFPPRSTFFFYLSHAQRRVLPSYRTYTYIHTYIHTHLYTYIYISIYNQSQHTRRSTLTYKTRLQLRHRKDRRSRTPRVSSLVLKRQESRPVFLLCRRHHEEANFESNQQFDDWSTYWQWAARQTRHQERSVGRSRIIRQGSSRGHSRKRADWLEELR